MVFMLHVATNSCGAFYFKLSKLTKKKIAQKLILQLYKVLSLSL